MVSKSAIINGDLTTAEKESISDTVSRLGRAVMTESAHGYQSGKDETILAAATRGTKDYIKHSQSSSAVAIMAVLLAANRNYNKQVEKHVQRMQLCYPGLTIKELSVMIEKADIAQKFKNVWGHNDARKFQTLKDVIGVVIPWLKNIDTPEHDFRVMSEWARNAKLSDRRGDPIGSIKYVGVATFQHLRMNFGAETVKPDRRVKEVLKNEFGLSLSDKASILAVERIAEVKKVSPLLIDQIFVKYGSGHYTAQSYAVQSAVKRIVKNMKSMQIPDAQIEKATGWSLRDIESA